MGGVFDDKRSPALVAFHQPFLRQRAQRLAQGLH